MENRLDKALREAEEHLITCDSVGKARKTEIMKELIAAIRHEEASRFAFAVLSASTLPAARNAVERIIEELPT